MGEQENNMSQNIQGQDWNEISWKKDNSANRSGGQTTQTQPRRNGPSNKTKALDDADEAGRHETVSLDLRLLIQKGRMAKKMSQAALAKAICEKQTTINEYESGKAQPNPQILRKLERALGVKLTGKAVKKK